MILIRNFLSVFGASAMLAATCASAQSAPEPHLAPSPARAELVGVETWLDGFMVAALEQADISGAVVVIVDHSQILVSKGYGFADVRTGKPVDPRQTLFRPASISKLFTATAVMQLVEAGKLDLDKDVEDYLDFALPPHAGPPITLRFLLTHRAGFEEKQSDRPTLSYDQMPTLAETVSARPPARIFEAGTTPAYSNYGVSLAGYIVQKVSGTPFENYVDSNIFQPLGMQRSTFDQSATPSIVNNFSQSYDTASGEAMPLEFYPDLPAGSLITTGDDMAKFMIAHLNGGKFGDRRILSEGSSAVMQESVLKLRPDMNGMALGFYETPINGRRALSHAGDLEWFHSNLTLFTDDGIGIFISLNSLGQSAGEMPVTSVIRRNLVEAFADRYLPASEGDGDISPATAREHAALVAGNYLPSRRSESNFFALLNLLGQLEVTASDDGSIRIRGERYIEVEPFRWRREHGHSYWTAIEANGAVDILAPDAPYIIYTRVSPSLSSGWLLPAFMAAVLTLFLAVASWPVIALTRRHFRAPPVTVGPERLSLLLVRLAAASAVASAAGWILMFGQLENVATTTREIDSWLSVLPALTAAGSLGGLICVAYRQLVLIRGDRNGIRMFRTMILAAAFGIVAWVAWNFRLLDFGTHY